MPACIIPMFPTFPLSFPHAHARLHFHILLAVSRTLAFALRTRRFLHDRSLPRSRPLVFALRARCFPHDHLLPLAVPARPFTHCALAVSCTPVRRTARSFPVCPLAASHFLLCLALPLRLALPSTSPPSASPCRRSQARHRTR
ncbi:hypothetical protein B0H13DRAFT_2370711 [Mycena leptocephala]|nr:hypothetical protein B0H13DRAFT_2370711 [Mycena leptocephala]